MAVVLKQVMEKEAVREIIDRIAAHGHETGEYRRFDHLARHPGVASHHHPARPVTGAHGRGETSL